MLNSYNFSEHTPLLPMLNSTVNSAFWIILTVFMNSDGDELSVVDRTET